MSSLTEEFKCAKARLEMTLTQSKDPVLKSVAPTVKSGRNWKAKQSVQQQVAVGHEDVMGHILHGHDGLGLATGKPMWSKASVVEKRKMVVEEIHRQEKRKRT